MVISNDKSFRVLFDKIASVFFCLTNILKFQHWKWSAQGTGTVPTVSAHICSLLMTLYFYVAYLNGRSRLRSSLRPAIAREHRISEPNSNEQNWSKPEKRRINSYMRRTCHLRLRTGPAVTEWWNLDLNAFVSVLTAVTDTVTHVQRWTKIQRAVITASIAMSLVSVIEASVFDIHVWGFRFYVSVLQGTKVCRYNWHSAGSWTGHFRC